MELTSKKLTVSTPGRVCLFGEHQDYLGLPVISCAVSRRITVRGFRRKDRIVSINLPDIGSSFNISLDEKINYGSKRDYIKSAFNVMMRNGFTFSKGMEAEVCGNIPINAGASSSSALTVSFINFLAVMSDQSEILPTEKIASLAYEAEVVEFGEPGGMMDHYSTAIGGIIYLNFFPEITVEKLSADIGAIVIADSDEPKNTTEILARVKSGVLNIVENLKREDESFSLHSVGRNEIRNHREYLSPEEFNLLEGTLNNREITHSAEIELKKLRPDLAVIGGLMNEHQKVLREVLKISTPKIDKMIEAALNAGAYGAKINGSGGGGTMFALAPENPEKVLNALKMITPDAFIVYPDKGTEAEAQQ